MPCRRTEVAEDAYLELADLLLSAPDPSPLLATVANLKASLDGMHSLACFMVVGSVLLPEQLIIALIRSTQKWHLVVASCACLHCFL